MHPTLTKTLHSIAIIFLLICKLTVYLHEIRIKNSKSFFPRGLFFIVLQWYNTLLLLGNDIVLLFTPFSSLGIKFPVL